MALPLSEIVTALEQLAPLELAEEWDNVGLIVEPTAQRLGTRHVARALLTIDLTARVMEEAIEQRVDLVVAYHPPVFRGLKRLRASVPAESSVVAALEHGIAIYSPHTALDAVPGGINDWLLEPFGPGERQFIVPSQRPDAGVGRTLSLQQPLPLSTLVERIREHLGIAHCRVAATLAHQDQPIRSVAVCAGSGGAVFERSPAVDLYLTGEMRHHDVLAKLGAGSSVVLCDHTNTERGYLPLLAARLSAATAETIEVIISRVDRDPLVIC
jgi:dinuclear metal center YbgI/SA1388 family protein